MRTFNRVAATRGVDGGRAAAAVRRRERFGEMD